MRPSSTYSATVIDGGSSGSCGTSATRRASSRRPSAAHVVAADLDGALPRDEPGDRPEQRALPGAVRADDRYPLPRLDRAADAVEDPGPAELDRQLSQRQRRHGPTLLLVRSTTAKNGAPKKAVTTPIGSSAGDTTVRASTSQRTRNPPPTSSDSGTTMR